ncbi:Niemann-Pick C1 protein [Vitis vinifera]|uniref:Niemann-Pick C1 protein n=1 Tax=Vitis vinifera TaxID=29760 RepID=A0A438EL21_VITVI|nr:Niemann-Pick C1 protein [Vitis vinifera]
MSYFGIVDNNGENYLQSASSLSVVRIWAFWSSIKWFAFIGQQADLGMPGSPYAINLRCSCGDCPSSPVCSDYEPPSPQQKDACSISLGSVKRKERIPASNMKPLLNFEDEKLTTLKVHEMVPQETNVQLSAVQGYMSSFYRQYGTWVAKNPSLVLCMSLAVVLILCLGLIRFKVETRPEKLWVGPGSRAAEEKNFFDSHLAPFYRIEQVLVSSFTYSSSFVIFKIKL